MTMCTCLYSGATLKHSVRMLRTKFGPRPWMWVAMSWSSEMHSGTNSNQAKGYGFIIPDIEGDDVFVHRQNLANAPFLTAGDTVTYELGDNQKKKKLQAVNVWVLRSLAEAPSSFESRQSRTNPGCASGSDQWSSRHDTWAATWGQHEWSHSQDQCSEGQNRWEGTGQSSHLPDALDVLVVSGNQKYRGRGWLG